MTVVLLFALSLLHGVFASGFIPILRAHAREQAPLAFALYFGGQVIGQLLVATVGPLRRHRLLYPAYEALFGLSLLSMGLFFHLAPASLVVGRGLEGLCAGLAMPLLFQCVAAAPALGRAERRIAVFNSLFAVGFVVGPPLVSLALVRIAPPQLLFGFGGAFVAGGGGHRADRRRKPRGAAQHDPTERRLDGHLLPAVPRQGRLWLHPAVHHQGARRPHAHRRVGDPAVALGDLHRRPVPRRRGGAALSRDRGCGCSCRCPWRRSSSPWPSPGSNGACSWADCSIRC